MGIGRLVVRIRTTMVEHKVCSRDDCPTTNIQLDGTTNCGLCNDVIHLMCIGIQRKTKDVLFHPNVMVICNKCMQLEPKMKSTSSSSTIKQSPIIKSSSFGHNNKSNPRQSSIADYTAPTKTDEVLLMLRDIQKTVNDTNDKVSSQSESTKSYSEVLKEIKEVTVSTNGKLSNTKPNSLKFSSVVSGNDSPFPSLNQRTPKRRRVEDTEKPKSQFKFRTLMPGTNSKEDHCLGAKIELMGRGSGVDKSKRVSQYAHLQKSIYISRLETSVTAEKITNYIKTKEPALNEKDFLLRMLVKKEQKLDELTFISYRLACTEELYTKFMDSSFWPEHVMIGEFIERERKQATVCDFIEEQSTQNDSTRPNLQSNNNEKLPEGEQMQIET